MSPLRIIAAFLFWALLQVLVLNHFFVFGYLNPYAYIAFILFLPLRSSRTMVLLLAFLLGMVIDIFENSGGVHIAATVFLAFIRRPILRFASQKSRMDFESIVIKKLGLATLSAYLLIAIFIHHFLLFLIESFHFNDIGTVLLRTIISTIFTFVIIFVVRLWNFRKKE